MKKMILSALVAFPAMVWAQGGEYKLTGKVGTLNAPSKMYLNYRADGKSVMDSSDIKNGAFAFKGTAAGITQATLILDHKGVGLKALGRVADITSVYLEKGAILVTSKDSLKNAVITGTTTNKEAVKYNKSLETVQKAMMDINTEYAEAAPEKRQDEEFVKSLRTRYDALNDEKEAAQKKYIAANPNSYFSLAAMQEIAGPSMEIAVIEPLYKGLSAELRDSKEGKEFAKLIESQRATSVGAMAPDFVQNDVNDKPVKLSDFKGKYVLLDFWASWCGPCRAENPNVVKAFNQYKEKNFTVLGVSLDQPGKKDSWLGAIEKDGLAWTQVSDLKFWDNEVAKLYGIRSIPQNYLVDPTGKIVGKNLRGEELDKKLAEVIK